MERLNEIQGLPIQAIEACTYQDLPKHTVVINILNLEYYLWVHIPRFAKDCNLFQVDEIMPNTGELLKFQYFMHQEYKKPWIRITSKILNTEIGQHIYRLHFVHEFTKDVISLYFSYIIQNDDPCKPYIYMNRSCNGG